MANCNQDTLPFTVAVALWLLELRPMDCPTSVYGHVDIPRMRAVREVSLSFLLSGTILSKESKVVV